MKKLQISDQSIGAILTEFKSHRDYKGFFIKGIAWKAGIGAIFLAGFFTGLYYMLPAETSKQSNLFFILLFSILGAAYLAMFVYLILSNCKVIDKQTTILSENGIGYLDADKVTVSYFMPYSSFQEYWSVKPKGEEFTLVYLRVGKMRAAAGAVADPTEIVDVLSRYVKKRPTAEKKSKE